YVTNDLSPLDADERRYVAQPAQLLGYLVGDKLAVGKHLKVAVRMLGQHLQKLGMHERFTADDAEEDVAHLLSFVHHFGERWRTDGLLLGGDINPATLAAQITAIDDRDVEEGWKDFAAFEPGLVPFDREHPFPAHVPGQLPEGPLVGFKQESLEHAQ